MHGVIFASLRDYVTAAYDTEVANAIFAGAPLHQLSEAYPDEQFGELIQRACEHVGQDPDTVLFDFGVFAGETTFTRLYPAFFAIAESSREFLLAVETRIHELVRATIPNAGPPELNVSEFPDGGISIVYASPRRLCVLLRGLTEGTARHYGERTEIVESACMRNGASACTFAVRFSPAAQRA